jgi:hypothetical protein
MSFLTRFVLVEHIVAGLDIELKLTQLKTNDILI